MGHAAAQTDPLTLLLGAHWVVQTVMVVLAAAVFVVVTVLIQKLVEFAVARRRLTAALRALQTAPGLTELSVALMNAGGPAPDMVALRWQNCGWPRPMPRCGAAHKTARGQA